MATYDDLRAVALSLPETSEGLFYGTPGFHVRHKGFLRLRGESDGGLVVFVGDVAEKDALVASDPEKFFTTPHYDGYPAVLVRLEAVDVDELRDLVFESWRNKAPARLLAAYLAEHPDA